MGCCAEDLRRVTKEAGGVFAMSIWLGRRTKAAKTEEVGNDFAGCTGLICFTEGFVGGTRLDCCTKGWRRVAKEASVAFVGGTRLARCTEGTPKQ